MRYASAGCFERLTITKEVELKSLRQRELELLSQIDSIDKRKHAIKDRIGSHAKLVQKLGADIDKKTLKKNNLSSQNESVKLQLVPLKNKLTKLDQKIDLASRNIQQKQEETRKIHAQVALLKQKLTKINERLESALRHVGTSKVKAGSTNINLREKKMELEILKNKIETLKHNLDMNVRIFPWLIYQEVEQYAAVKKDISILESKKNEVVETIQKYRSEIMRCNNERYMKTVSCIGEVNNALSVIYKAMVSCSYIF